MRSQIASLRPGAFALESGFAKNRCPFSLGEKVRMRGILNPQLSKPPMNKCFRAESVC
jgi:hypothetical protein